MIEFTTRRGFTGNEHLDSVNLIHMNGRVYDPWLGQFLSADPVDGNVHLSQRLARYSYVMNSPHSYTDPSGFLETVDGQDAANLTQRAVKQLDNITVTGQKIERAPPAWGTMRSSSGTAAYWSSVMGSMWSSGWGEAAKWLDNPALALMGQGLGGTAVPLPFDMQQALIEEATLGDALEVTLLATGGLSVGGIRIIGGKIVGRNVAATILPRLHMGQQGKHIIGHPHYIAGRSILRADPARLAERAGTGRPVNNVARGQPGFREHVDFGETIGDFVKDGVASPTTNGIIHYGKRGIHIVPAAP